MNVLVGEGRMSECVGGRGQNEWMCERKTE